MSRKRIRHVFLTHSHLDHTASLPIFIENAWTPTGECPRIYGSSETLDAVQRHIFNDVMWPDFVFLSTEDAPVPAPVPTRHRTAGGSRWSTRASHQFASITWCRPSVMSSPTARHKHRCWRYWTNRTVMGSRASGRRPQGSVLGGVFPEFAEAPGRGVPSSHPQRCSPGK